MDKKLTDKTKKCINLNQETVQVLEKLTEKFGSTENTIIAIAVQKYGMEWGIICNGFQEEANMEDDVKNAGE